MKNKILNFLKRTLLKSNTINKNVYCVYTKQTGQKWYLHSQIVKLRNGSGYSKTYYFCLDVRRNVCADLPFGFDIVFSPKTGMPMLKKSR